MSEAPGPRHPADRQPTDPQLGDPCLADRPLADSSLADPSLGDRRPDSGRPLRADARRNRDKVLRAAREAFARSGFDVPLDEIAALAGVGPGTVYRHFPSKEALFEAVIAARLRDIADDARARAAAPDPGPAFFGFLSRMRDEAAAKRDLPDAIAVQGPLRDEVLACMEALLKRAQQAHAARPDVTMPDLLVLLKGLFRSLQDTPAGDDGEAQRQRLFRVIADGLRPHGP
ncbi:MAG TPA: helix-turn-helix domain-containing protein [Trebonia sp.]|jgi:AcrR family transcriptional regulator|nr:helix-turn-helix domain-containing protein [Trebonia sp.]